MQVMATRNPKMHPGEVRLVVYHIIYDGFVAPSQVVGNGISEPSTVAKSFGDFLKGSSAWKNRGDVNSRDFCSETSRVVLDRKLRQV